MTNRIEAIAAYSLTRAGRAEIRTKEIGYSILNPECKKGFPEDEPDLDLKTHMKSGEKYDDVMRKLRQQIENSEPLILAECSHAASLVSRDAPDEAERHEFDEATARYNDWVSHYDEMPDDARFREDP
jgi:hypothetical protein